MLPVQVGLLVSKAIEQLDACYRETSVEGSQGSVNGTVDPALDRAVPEALTALGVGRNPAPSPSWVRGVSEG